jgi:hypothetical protein
VIKVQNANNHIEKERVAKNIEERELRDVKDCNQAGIGVVCVVTRAKK